MLVSKIIILYKIYILGPNTESLDTSNSTKKMDTADIYLKSENGGQPQIHEIEKETNLQSDENKIKENQQNISSTFKLKFEEKELFDDKIEKILSNYFKNMTL